MSLLGLAGSFVFITFGAIASSHTGNWLFFAYFASIVAVSCCDEICTAIKGPKP